MKLLLLFLVLIGLVSGSLIGMNAHELSKDNLDKGDTAVSVTNIIIGVILFIIGLGLLLFPDRVAAKLVTTNHTVKLHSDDFNGHNIPRKTSSIDAISNGILDSVKVPEELNLSSI